MPLYEHVFIARQDISGTQVDQMVEAFAGVVETGGGKVVGTESWGLRNLAYRIKKNRKGHYVMMNLDAPPDAILELERQQRIHDDILRYLTLRVDEHEEGPSIMMQGRKDRGPRRDDEDGDRDKPTTPIEAAPETETPDGDAPAEAAPETETPDGETSAATHKGETE
ncbi:MAG: 30S ribosomal protein S6 [Alphaproteobacteria bacterium]|nr:30S ribosomal protein S6 [Alphaproteobacteria bacterium]